MSKYVKKEEKDQLTSQFSQPLESCFQLSFRCSWLVSLLEAPEEMFAFLFFFFFFAANASFDPGKTHHIATGSYMPNAEGKEKK